MRRTSCRSGVSLAGLDLDNLDVGEDAGRKKTAVGTGGIDAQGVGRIPDLGIRGVPIHDGGWTFPELGPVDRVIATALGRRNGLGRDPLCFADRVDRLGAPGLAGTKAAVHADELRVGSFVEGHHLVDELPILEGQLVQGLIVVGLQNRWISIFAVAQKPVLVVPH